MIKHLQKIGNSKGIVIDKPILDLLRIDENGAFEVTQKRGGLFLKPVNVKGAYKKYTKRNRHSLGKFTK
jgi:hypothetical protein